VKFKIHRCRSYWSDRSVNCTLRCRYELGV